MAEQQHQEQQQQEQQQQEDQQQQQQEDQQQQEQQEQEDQQLQEQQEQSQQNTDFPEFFFPFTFAIHQQSPQPSSQNANDQSEISPTIHFFVYPIPATEAGAQTPFIFFTPFFFPQESRRNVSESTMKELPIVEITQEHLDTQATCPICLETFSLSSTNKDDDNKTSDEKSTCSEPIRQMPCKHMFCESCLFQWLKQNNTCPLCRMEIESDNTSQQSDEQTSTESTAVPSQEDVTMDNASLPTSTESNSSTHTHSHHHNHHNHHSQPQPPLQQPQVSVGCDLGSVGCCDELQNNESHTTSPIITLPQCHHRFHASCLRTSLIVEGYSFESLTSQPLCFHCPTCRSPEIIQSDVLKMSSANLPSPQEQHQSSLPHLPVIIPHLPSDSDEMDLD